MGKVGGRQETSKSWEKGTVFGEERKAGQKYKMY